MLGLVGRWIATFGLVAAASAAPARLWAQEAPYSPSRVIAGVDWQFDTHAQFARGSDQWPLTWARDGALYAGWGDGWGWVKDDRKFSLGITRIDGEPPKLTGTDLWGIGPGSGVAKPEALVAISDKLYLFWTKGQSKSDVDNTHVAVSTDGGQAWSLSEKRLLPSAPAGFRVRAIGQFGPGYTGAIDEFVYLYFGFNRATELYLARVAKDSIDDASRYEWFAGQDANEAATWTPGFDQKQPVFRDPAGSVWHVGVSYHPGLGRFLLTKPHANAAKLPKPGPSSTTGLGVFDAPRPWGPWTTVSYQDRFKDDFMKFSYFLPPKFFSADGRTVWLVWSGYPEYDNVNFVRGTLRLNGNRGK